MAKRQRPEGARPSTSRAPSEIEIVYGLRAGLAVFGRRREDVLRIAHAREVRNAIRELARFAAARGIPCDEHDERELARLAASTHHEGLVLATRARRWTPPSELAPLLARSGGIAIALDRVRNPYNVGAILRSAAFFGLDAALFGAQAPHPGLAPDAVRVAEGGAEHLALSRTTDLAHTLARLRANGVRVIGVESDGRESVFGFAFPQRALIVVGHEREGISERVRAQCDTTLAIPGGGAIGSLNVAVAASLVIAEAMRRRARV
jgi:TrmH RNA methyltransferase